MIAPARIPSEGVPAFGPMTCPLVLVLEPTLAGWPWTDLAPRAVATLQVLGLANHLQDPGVRATLSWAVERDRAQAVVIGKEGAGPPWEDSLAAFTRLSHALSGLLAVANPGTTPPVVNGLWFDTTSRQFHLLGRDPRSGALREEAPCSDTLRLLVGGVLREVRR